MNANDIDVPYKSLNTQQSYSALGLENILRFAVVK